MIYIRFVSGRSLGGGGGGSILINSDERTVGRGMIYAISGAELFMFCSAYVTYPYLPTTQFRPFNTFSEPTFYTHTWAIILYFGCQHTIRVRKINPSCHIFSHSGKQDEVYLYSVEEV